MKPILSLAKTSMQKINHCIVSVFCSLLAINYAVAAPGDGFDIGGPGDDSALAGITNFIQDIVDFVDGPVALAFSFVSIAGMAVTWAIAPKMTGAMGVFIRVLIAVIIILNIGAWIAAYQGD